jgi:predicted adenine nucleotide alpha hydrolase (AANH) superfamily ATPase
MKPPAPPKLLLHACCAPCATHPVRLLRERFDVVVYFDNPNIQPAGEYRARLEEIRSLAARWKFPLLEGGNDGDAWLAAVAGHEEEPEGAVRCEICYRFRLERTARRAKASGMDGFASTLSISPHKKADVINRIGGEAGDSEGILFIDADFKKKDGFKASCDLSRLEGLYRQDYCGCVFSRRDRRKD